MGTMSNVATGLCQYLYWDQYTAGSPAGNSNRVGIVGGGSGRDADSPNHRSGMGGFDRVVGGMILPAGSINFLPEMTGLSVVPEASATPYTNLGLLAYAFRPRTTGYPCQDLPEFALYAGVSPDGAGSWGQENYLQCKVASVTLECSVGEPLQATIEWQALRTADANYSLPTVTAASYHFEWKDATCLLEGVGYALQGFTLTVENTLIPITDLDGASDNEKRFYKALKVGNEMTRLEIRTDNKLPKAVRGNLADNLPVNLDFSGTFLTENGDSLLVEVAGMANSSGESPFLGDSDTVAEFSYGFECAHNSQAADLTLTPAA